MTTSGSRDFNLDVAEIIEEAFERCGIEVRTGYDARTARRSLNLMFAEWANRGLNLWTVNQATITVTVGVATYTVNADHADILEMVLRRDGTDYEVERISRGDFFLLPNKTTQGRPSQFYYDRQIAPKITVWQVPENSTDQLIYYYVRRLVNGSEAQGTITTDLPRNTVALGWDLWLNSGTTAAIPSLQLGGTCYVANP
jgi:hypothetical protein